MMRTTKHLSILIVLVASLAIAAACQDDTGYSASAVENNDTNNDQNNDENNDQNNDDNNDDNNDVNNDPPVVANPRTLVEAPLLGSLPVENGFFDPLFAQIDGRFWLAYDIQRFDFATLRRTVLTETPTGTPAVSDFGNGPGGQRLLLGGARAPLADASYASIWVGSRSENQQRPPLEIALIGATINGEDTAFVLDWTADPPMEINGVFWSKAEVNIPQTLYGFVYLSVTGLEQGNYMLNGPVLTATASKSGQPSGIVQLPTTRRPSVNEATALGVARKRLINDEATPASLVPKAPRWAR